METKVFEPATIAQRAYLHRLNVGFADSISKSEASVLIDAKLNNNNSKAVKESIEYDPIRYGLALKLIHRKHDDMDIEEFEERVTALYTIMYKLEQKIRSL